MGERKSIMLYLDSIEQWDMLTDEQAGVLIKALLRYSKTGKQLETSDGMIKMAYSFITAQIDRDGAKYDAKCEKNKQIALEREERKRTRTYTNVNERERTYTNSTDTDTDTDTDKDTDKDKDKDIIKSNSITRSNKKRFEKPTIEQVQEYCRERKNNVNAERFVDYYESNGWKVGKNAMKDWKAAVRTWERNGYSNDSRNDSEEDLSGIPAEQLEILRKMRC